MNSPTRKGTFIVKIDADTGQVIRIENHACAAEPIRLGSAPAEREVCGRPGRHQVGGLWLCNGHLEAVLRDVAARSRSATETAVSLTACIFPDHGEGQSARLCGEPAVAKVGDAPACGLHYDQALAWHREMLADEKKADDALADEADRRREAEMRTWRAQGSQIVYYLRRADGAVKIGTSANFRSRLRDLTDEHGALEILLTHCGDFPREKEMHRKFADLLIGREWFRAEEPLLSWIEWVRCRRLNMRTAIPGTVPIRRVRDLLREARTLAAADPAA